MGKIDLEKNNNCVNCDSKFREIDQDNALCLKTNSIIDGLPIRCVGGWGRDKVKFLQEYMTIFGNAMKKGWDGLAYIEICSGPGICIDRKTRREFYGSPLAVLMNPNANYLNKFLFIDYNQKVLKSLRARIKQNSDILDEIKSKTKVLHGDYNKPTELLEIISHHIPKRYLVVLFIDPTDFSVPFETIVKLMKVSGGVDIIINGAIYTDFNRNSLLPYIKPGSRVQRKYERALGNNNFFNSDAYIEAAKNENLVEIRQLFRDAYISNFNKFGYNKVDEKKIDRFYHLFFASKHSLGLKFWKLALKQDANGQRYLPL